MKQFRQSNERGKLRYAIYKNQNKVSQNLLSIFNAQKRDKDQYIIEALSLLTAHPVVTLRFFIDTMGINLALFRRYLYLLRDCGAVNIYTRRDKLYRSKMFQAFQFQRKSKIIELLKYTQSIEEGKEFFDHKKFQKLLFFQTANSKLSIELDIKRTRAELVEITDKGKKILGKFLSMYSMLITNKHDIGITDNVNALLREYLLKSQGFDLELFQKDPDELLKLIKSKDVIDLLMIQKNNLNNNE